MIEAKLSQLEPYLKTEPDELLIELGKKIFDNLVLLDEKIIGTNYYPQHKVVFKELLEIVDKIRELEK